MHPCKLHGFVYHLEERAPLTARKDVLREVAVVPVGITAAMVNRQPTTLVVTEQNVARAMVKPRKPESNKGSYGRLLCVCGSVGMAGGTQVLSAKAAIRCGAGGKRRIAVGDLSHCGVPGGRAGLHAPEPLAETLALSGSERNLLSFLSRSTACLIGCGLGNPLLRWRW